DGSAAEKMMAHQFKQPTSLAELAPQTSAELIEVVNRLMQKKPEERFVSAREVVEALRPFVRKTNSQLRPANKAQTVRPSVSDPPSASFHGPSKSPAPSAQ